MILIDVAQFPAGNLAASVLLDSTGLQSGFYVRLLSSMDHQNPASSERMPAQYPWLEVGQYLLSAIAVRVKK